jgi:hypothetical protein
MFREARDEYTARSGRLAAWERTELRALNEVLACFPEPRSPEPDMEMEAG